MIVARCALFTGDFVVGDQVAEIFPAKNVVFSTASARNSCHLRPFADLAIWIFDKASTYGALHLIRWKVEDLDDAVLEGRLGHFLRFRIFHPPNFP